MEHIDNKLIKDDDIEQVGDNTFIFKPFNEHNIEITLHNIQTILSKYNIPIQIYNIELYKRAFVHKSYIKRPELENKQQNIIIEPKPNNCMELKTKSNERLEFLGDGVLECITKYYLYRRFPKQNEGFMTEKKIAIVKNEAIGKIAYEMGLHKWLIISKSAEEKKMRTNHKKLGCLFEAFLGALFLDFNKINIQDDEGWFKDIFVTGPGFQMAQKFIENIFETHIDWTELIQNNDNYKNILQVKLQKEFKVTPDYLEISRDVDNGYEMGVYLCIGSAIYSVNINTAKNLNTFNNFSDIHAHIQKHKFILILLGKGTHKIKKKAEQQACEIALQILEQQF